MQKKCHHKCRKQPKAEQIAEEKETTAGTGLKINRLMIAALSSGSGKTMITCGFLQLLKRKGLRLSSFKCGPDFIDPMFHTQVLGTKSRNLDLFFTDEARTRMLFMKNAAGSDLAVLEGVMGYYDGMTLESPKAGASDLARATKTPVLLIVPARGMSLSLVALIRGFLDFEKEKNIRGIILNHVSGMLYPRLKAMIEEKIPEIRVVGYVPEIDDTGLSSRHLGLLRPNEILDLQQKLDRLADIFAQTLDLPEILRIAAEAPDLSDREAAEEQLRVENACRTVLPDPVHVRIGLAKDDAFCFFYADNLELLESLGAELVPFSPIEDASLPEDLDGLLLHGGYPELYAEDLSKNIWMRREIREAVKNQMPTQAECGGFLYLHRSLSGPDQKPWKMAGVLPADARYTGHLTRFGYCTLSGASVFDTDVGSIRSHEFHYCDSADPGTDFLAEKPDGRRSWHCAKSTRTLYAGFPHLYYYAAPEIAVSLIARCREYHAGRTGGKT